jgi:hypothetical protein
MRIDELEKALDRYGGDLGRWPAPLRAEAAALIAGDPKAAKLAAAAARLDALLAEATLPVAVDSALMGRIVAGIDNGVHHEAPLRPTPKLAAWAGAAMIAFLTAGYAVGLALPVSQGEDALAGLMFGNSQASDTATDTGSVL